MSKTKAEKKTGKRTVKMTLEVDLSGEDRLITKIRINGKGINNDLIIALAGPLQRYHLKGK